MLNTGNQRQLMSDNSDACTGLFHLGLDETVPFKSGTNGWEVFHITEKVGLTRAIPGPRPVGVACVDVFPGYPAR
jgi:hypothetical protein